MKHFITVLITVSIMSFMFIGEVQAATCQAIEVTSSRLNVRTGHSTNYSKIGMIHRGERYVVAGSYGAWKKIWFDTGTKWIYARYTKAINASCGIVNTAKLNIRSGPSTYYRNVGQAYRGSKWVITASSGSWKRIWYKSEARWVHKDYVTPPQPRIRLTGFNINHNAVSTNSRYVTTYPVVSGSPKYYQISNNQQFKYAKWRSYSSHPSYTLSEGDGTKRLYFRVKDGAGRLSNTLFDDIRYKPPVGNRSINKTTFFQNYRATFGRLNTSQVNGIDFLLNKIVSDKEPARKNKTVWVRQIAYMLATIKHEVANKYQPITEYSNTTCRRYDGGCTYKGRGYVQLTHKYNYRKLSPIVGVDLVSYPLKALNPAISYRVTSYGMHHGTFTGAKLGSYVKSGKTDYWNARRVINGIDRASLIKGYAVKFQSILEASAK